ncbi:MAG: NADPH-dependent glutamate synthase [Ethanoligenens sp.]
MPNMNKTKLPAPEQAPDVRITNFEEVTGTYTPEMAREEAQRCLNCKNRPCVDGCPVNVQIPEFIKLIADGDDEGAYAKISETNALPAVCGRVCPQESQCEGKCIRGIKGEPVGIGRLERYAADTHREKGGSTPSVPASNGHHIAIVGSGPAGLACAGALAQKGYEVTVYEAFHTPGGVLMYGIPEFRLPKSIVAQEVENLTKMGVTINTNSIIGRLFTIEELINEMGYEAVFIGSGAGLPRFMGIPGEALVGVYSANEFLTRVNLMKAYKENYDTPIKKSQRVAVIGGGNVAMDAARSAKRLGAKEVYIVYRRSEVELPARAEEVHHAKQEGIIFKFLTSPVEIHGDDKGIVRSIECVEMELGEPDASGRRRPKTKEGSNFEIPLDSVIMAIGTTPNPLITSTTPGLDANSHGCIVADEDGKTTHKAVYAGGDAVTGAATVILAMGAGRQAAHAIDEYVKSKVAVPQ